MTHERIKVEWEWQLCHVDAHDDVQELEFAESLSEFRDGWNRPMDGCVRVEIRLVRSEYTESAGCLDRHEFYPNAANQLVCDDAPNMHCRKKSQREFDAFV